MQSLLNVFKWISRDIDVYEGPKKKLVFRMLGLTNAIWEGIEFFS